MKTFIRENIVGIVLFIFVAGFIVLLAMGVSKQDAVKSKVYDDCTPTDHRVYVPGRIGKVLTIYDCKGEV